MSNKKEIQKNKQTLTQHLAELRRRLIYVLSLFFVSSVCAYFFAEVIYDFLMKPLVDVLDNESGRRFIYTNLTDVFFTYMKLSAFVGAMVTLPYFSFHLWHFIMPGLYDREKKLFFPLLFFTPALFFLGAAFVYYIVFPMAWSFFIGFETTNTLLPIQLEAKIDEYFSLVISLILAFGFCFELPILIYLLARAGLVSRDSLKRKRKYAVLIIFIVAAFLTPPDIVSQIALAVPLLILYEFSILLIRDKPYNETTPQDKPIKKDEE